MAIIEEKIQLEESISELLDEAISLIDRKGRAINLYTSSSSRDISYVYYRSEGVTKYWTGKHPNGYTMTKRGLVTKEEFLEWMLNQPYCVKEQVHQNLLDYINIETPKERGEVEFPESRYLFGY